MVLAKLDRMGHAGTGRRSTNIMKNMRDSIMNSESSPQKTGKLSGQLCDETFLIASGLQDQKGKLRLIRNPSGQFPFVTDPTSYGGDSHALSVQQRLKEFYIPRITSIQHNGEYVEPPRP